MVEGVTCVLGILFLSVLAQSACVPETVSPLKVQLILLFLSIHLNILLSLSIQFLFYPAKTAKYPATFSNVFSTNSRFSLLSLPS